MSPAAPSLSECALISVASRSIVNRSGTPASSHARERARACAARSRSSPPGSRAIASITRNAVASEATAPNSGAWSRTVRRSHNASPPSASMTARSRITRPGSCPPRRRRNPPSPSDNARVSPVLSATCAEQRAARVRHQTLSVRRDLYGEVAAIALHLQGDPPELALGPSASRTITAQADVPAPRNPQGAATSCMIRVSESASPSPWRSTSGVGGSISSRSCVERCSHGAPRPVSTRRRAAQARRWRAGGTFQGTGSRSSRGPGCGPRWRR